MNDLKLKAGFMTVEQAAEKLGVSLRYFKTSVSKHIGSWIGNKKYYTEQDLENWLNLKKEKQI